MTQVQGYQKLECKQDNRERRKKTRNNNSTTQKLKKIMEIEKDKKLKDGTKNTKINDPTFSPRSLHPLPPQKKKAKWQVHL